MMSMPDGPAAMPQYAHIPRERMGRGTEFAAVVIRPAEQTDDGVALVSRSHSALVARLLEALVPELTDGRITIRRLVRDPGAQAKLAVVGNEPGIDAVAVVRGPGDANIRAVEKELGAERVDVVEWSDDAETFIRNSLVRPEIISVELDTPGRAATVVVPTASVRVIRGLRNVNARLSTYLTRWKVTVVPDVPPEPRRPVERASAPHSGPHPSGPPSRGPRPPERSWRSAPPRAFAMPARALPEAPPPPPPARPRTRRVTPRKPSPDEKPALVVQLGAPEPAAPQPAPVRPAGQDFDELECVDAVQRVMLLIGHAPSPGEYQQVRTSGELGDLPSAATIVHRVGGWGEAVDLASMMPDP